MKELIIAFGLFLFIEGILYALFPSKMKSMLKKLELIKDSQLRSGGLIFAVLGFVIIYYVKELSMKKIKFYIFNNNFYFSVFQFNANSKTIPASFADLAERLMPSVVNISSTQTVVTNSKPIYHFTFPPGSPLEDMFKEFGTPQERKSAALGSGFIIDEKGIVVTNNHVIQDAEDIVVTVNGDKEFKAKVIGADPFIRYSCVTVRNKRKI